MKCMSYELFDYSVAISFVVMNLIITDLLHITLILHFYIREALSEELYVGCYTNFSGLSIGKNPIQSVSQCLNKCRSQISSFAAIKNGSTCYCGNITNTRVPSFNCNLTCNVNSGICGGNNLFAVYTEIPTYQGCFKDSSDNRDLKETIKDYNDMTMEMCYEKCSSLNYTFMGVQSGGSCFCGQQYGKHGKTPESDCNMTCTGDRNQICGGLSRNSVYSVGHIPFLNKNYDEVFHCLNGATVMHGTCTSKTCQPGWKGTKCNQRDYVHHINHVKMTERKVRAHSTLIDGNCGEHKCGEITIGNQIISECICTQGFQSISIYDVCTDVDECTLNICNSTTSTCSNTLGSFDCICKEGFVKIPLNQIDWDCDNKLHEFTCLSHGLYKQSSLEGNITPDKKDLIILATFLAFVICTQIFLISAVLFYRSKIKKLAMKIKELNTKAMAGSSNDQLDFSNQSLNNHNYSELANNKRPKK